MGLVYHWQRPASAHTDSMPVQLDRIVIDAHDLPGLARFRTQALGWKVRCERAGEIVIRTEENAPVGMSFLPVTDPKTVENRLNLQLTSGGVLSESSHPGVRVAWPLPWIGWRRGRLLPCPRLVHA